MSLAKTGYLASSNECKKEFTIQRREDQPTVHELLKDLGQDSSGGRRRRIGAQQKRLLKGGRRNAKLLHLKIKARPIRIRVWKTSVHSAACYGLEAQGIAPQRLQTLRTQLKCKLFGLMTEFHTLDFLGAHRPAQPERLRSWLKLVPCFLHHL